MKLSRVLLSIILFITFSCKKSQDIPDPDVPSRYCRVAELHNPDGKIIYYFDENNLAVASRSYPKHGPASSYAEYEYKNGKLSCIIYYDSIFHNADKSNWGMKLVYEEDGNKVIEHWYTNLPEYPNLEMSRTIYFYNKNGALTRTEGYAVYHGDLIDKTVKEYETDSNNNITKMSSYDTKGQLSETYTYTYDDKINAQLGLPEYTILKTGKNNPLKLTVKGAGMPTSYTYAYMYTYNEEGYPLSDGLGTEYKYSCADLP
jgi:hypothetical protein